MAVALALRRSAVLPWGVAGVFGALVLGGCNGRSPPAAASTVASMVCGDAVPSIKALGTPVEEARFALSSSITEFRVKLLNHYHLPRDAGVTIMERTWASGDCRLTIWSTGDGRSIDLLRWSKGDQF